MSEAVYENTVSIGQTKSVTGQDLVRELQNYIAGYEGGADSTIDLQRANQMLKMTLKSMADVKWNSIRDFVEPEVYLNSFAKALSQMNNSQKQNYP